MNRIKFDAKILDLYSIDYDYLQDSVEDEVAKLLRQTIANPGEAGIIKGCKLKVSPSDTSKVMIYSDGTWNSAFSNEGIMVEFEENVDLIAPSDSTPGTLNYIYIRSYTVDGTYNKKAGVIEEGVQKAIDYYDYARVYDRRLDAWEIVVYTRAEYLNLTDEERYALIYVGYFIAGTPITVVSTTGRNNIKTFLADGSVTTESISPTGMLLPQINVDNSATIYDRYAFTFEPVNLEEDLNKIRSIVRSARGTATWDEDDPNNLRVFDASVSALHSNGVLEDVLEELTIVPNSTGLAVVVTSGKALIDGVIQSVSDATHQLLPIEAQPSYSIYSEDHSFGPVLPCYVYLNYQNISVVEVRGNAGGLYVGVEGTDYLVYASTGALYIPATSNFNYLLGDLFVRYNYGFPRYDVIEIGPNIECKVVKGTSATSTGSIPNLDIPPDIPVMDEGYVPLSVIKVVPNIIKFTYNHIKPYKRFTPYMRDLLFTACTDTSTIQTSVNKISYHKANTTIDEFYSVWSPGTYDNIDYYTSSTNNSYITTAVMCTEDDGFWLIVDKSIATNTIYVEWNSSPELDYDSNITLDLQWRYPLHYYPIKVVKGLSTGIHKFKITKIGTNPFNFYGTLVGKPDTFYKEYSLTEIENYFDKILVEETSNNIAIGVDNLLSGIAGTDNVAVGSDALFSNTVGNQNVAIGGSALINNISGNSNVAIGYQAGSGVTSASNVISIGTAGTNIKDNAIYIGNVYSDTNSTASANVVVGSDGRLQRTTSVDDKGVPIGTIVAWLPGYYDSGHLTYTNILLDTYLPTNWKVCDGTALYDADSPIFNSPTPPTPANRYLPKLNDDRFLMGSGSGSPGIKNIGDRGGANAITAHTFTDPVYYANNHAHIYSLNYGQNMIDSANTQVSPTIYNHCGATHLWGVPATVTTGGYYTDAWYATTWTAQSWSWCTLHTSGVINNNHGTDSNLPQYIACKYIMRIK